VVGVAGTASDARLDSAAVCAELNRILGSREFQGFERRSRLLKYLVDKAIAGEPVKEYMIGVDVFEKPPDYDPRIDPAVRVEIGRMRTRLADYYAGAGNANPSRLEFPKRSYVPTLRAANPAAPLGPTRRPRIERLWPAALVAAVLCAGGVTAWRVLAAAGRQGPDNPQARELCVKARFFWNKRTTEALRTSLELYQEAIRLEPRYAPAYAGEALCFAVMATNSQLPADQTSRQAKEAAGAALTLDPSVAEAHAALGLVAFAVDADWNKAETELQRAVALDPRFATAYQWLALSHVYSGKAAEAPLEIGKALALDPLSMPLYAADGMISYYLRRYDETVQKARKMLEMDASFREAHLMLGETLEALHDWNGAEREFHTVELASTGDREGAARLAHLYALTGRKAAAEKILRTLLEPAADQYVDPYQVAFIYTAMGDKHNALEWLEKAVRQHTATVMNVDPYLDSLRDEPRFSALLTEAHLN
jgi:tetratricopeptide (TPR) repeat protein